MEGPMQIDLEKHTIFRKKSDQGGKARGLTLLKSLNLNVPKYISFSEQEWLLSQYQVLDLWEEWGCPPMAVRSSCSHEDGTDHSFAGIFESIMPVCDRVALIAAVDQCFQSLQSERASEYCIRHGLSSSQLRMFVVLQEFIEPEVSGVLFTMHPLASEKNKIYSEMHAGRGSELVDGKVVPATLELDWFSEDVYSLTVSETITLSPEVLKKLRKQCLQIQAHAGCPQDIEFALRNNEFYFLQTRNITKWHVSESVHEWTNAQFRDGGVSCSVVSPMMWRLYERSFVHSLPAYMQELKLIDPQTVAQTKWYNVFYGRPYWNVSAVKKIQSQIPGYVERNFDQDLSIAMNYTGNGVENPMTLLGALRALPLLLRVNIGYSRQIVRANKALLRFTNLRAQWDRLDLAQLSEEEFSQTWTWLLQIHFDFETSYFATIYNASNAKLDFLRALDRKDAAFLPLISDLEQMKALQPIFRLQNIAKEISQSPLLVHEMQSMLSDRIGLADIEHWPENIQKLLSDYIRDFGHHSDKELDLHVPRWREDLKMVFIPLLGLIRNCEQQHFGNDSEILNSKKRQSAQIELQKLKSSQKGFSVLKLPLLLRKLKIFRTLLSIREDQRETTTHIYSWIRTWCLEFAHKNQLNEYDVFMLYPAEISDYLMGRATLMDLRQWIHQRTILCQSFSRFSAPNEIGKRYTQGNESTTPTYKQNSFIGIGCSPGKIRGRVKILNTPSDADRVVLGDILVAPYTDPGWTPVFSLVSAVITETGGLLSHAAIIAREYGIPCVLGVFDATRKLKDGDWIELDGDNGTVHCVQPM